MPSRHPIQSNEIGKLEVDSDNRLWWDGKLVMTEVRLSLPWAVNVAAILAAGATIVSAIVALLSYLQSTPTWHAIHGG